MLRQGLNSAKEMKLYNQKLKSQRWAALGTVQPSAGRDYLLWHVPSGSLASATDVPGRLDPVENPKLGWLGPCSGSEPLVPAVGPPSILLHVQVLAEPAWFTALSIPVPVGTAAAEPLKRAWLAIRHRVRDVGVAN